MLTPQEQEQLRPIAEALLAMGYQPADMVWDAAVRMSFAPDLLPDFFSYAGRFSAAGGRMPAPWQDTAGQLPGGYTVETLMRDYLLAPTGAWLMAAALISHTAEAQAALEKIVVDGMTVVEPDGSLAIREVPAAARYPRCPRCDSVLTRQTRFCTKCGAQLGG